MKSNLQHTRKTVLDRINTLKLPTLPAGTPFLLKSLTDKNIDFVELATILEKSPSIAGKPISLANSAWSAPVTAVTSLAAWGSVLSEAPVSRLRSLRLSMPLDAHPSTPSTSGAAPS